MTTTDVFDALDWSQFSVWEDGRIRTDNKRCPLQQVSGAKIGYVRWVTHEGLSVEDAFAIMTAADSTREDLPENVKALRAEMIRRMAR